jgi:hypothetical protein
MFVYIWAGSVLGQRPQPETIEIASWRRVVVVVGGGGGGHHPRWILAVAGVGGWKRHWQRIEEAVQRARSPWVSEVSRRRFRVLYEQVYRQRGTVCRLSRAKGHFDKVTGMGPCSFSASGLFWF